MKIENEAETKGDIITGNIDASDGEKCDKLIDTLQYNLEQSSLINALKIKSNFTNYFKISFQGIIYVLKRCHKSNINII